jgi:hypothetical protein
MCAVDLMNEFYQTWFERTAAAVHVNVQHYFPGMHPHMYTVACAAVVIIQV